MSSYTTIKNVRNAFLIFVVYSGSIVSAQEPSDRLGVYWGYTVRVATKFEDIFDECPYKTAARPKDSYDLKLAISNDKATQNSEMIDFYQYSGFRHALVFFGGLEGIEGIVEQDERSKINQAEDVRKMFD